MTHSLPPVPERGGGAIERSAVVAARTKAMEAMLEADELAKSTARAKRHAANLLKTYESLLAEYNGQMRLPGT